MASFTLSAVAVIIGIVLVVWQARSIRRRAQAWPEVRGRRGGVCRGRAPTLNIWAIGEASAVGVGVATPNESVVAQTAEELARLTGRRIRWHVRGRPGLRAAEVGRDHLPGPADAVPDVMVLILGVSDALALGPVSAWRSDLEHVLETIRIQISPGVPVVLAGIPPLRRVPALKPPASWALGVHGSRLNRVARRLAQTHPHVWFMPTPAPRRTTFAADGLQPGWRACRDWGRVLAGTCCQLLAPHLENGYRDPWPWYQALHAASRDETR